MQPVRLFTWWRLFLLLALLTTAGLWRRSYACADGLNYRTHTDILWSLRIQWGAVVLERIDESTSVNRPRMPQGLWYEALDPAPDTTRWGWSYDPDARRGTLGFIWTRGTYMQLQAPDLSQPVGPPDNALLTWWEKAEGWAVPMWFIAALCSGLLALQLPAIAAALRQRRRMQAGHCPHCGYDLRASPSRCPECGTPAAKPTAK